MKTLDIQLVGQGSGIYNACDRTGFHRGKPGKGQQAPARIYSVYAVVDGGETACTQSWDIWGNLYEAGFPLNTLEAYGPRKR